MSSSSSYRLLCACIAASLVSAFAAPSFAAAEEWKECGKRGDIVIERAAVEGSKFYDYRARAKVPLPPATIIAKIWGGVISDYPPSVTKREVISKSDDDMVVYDHIKTPVVSDRDITTKLHRIYNPTAGTYEIEFHSANELGPPPQHGFVRIPVVRGRWTIVPDGAGSAVTYRCYSEPGGSVPAFLVRGTLQDETTRELERVLQHLLGKK